MSPSRPRLSLCMILRNEARNLRRSLAPVARLFDEVVAVDTGSTDGTPELAASLGAKVIGIPWPDDFAAARNVSIREASGDYALWLDADNALRPEDVARLRSILEPRPRAVLWCTEVVVPDGERLIQKRVFPLMEGVRFEGRVHEQLVHPPDLASILTPVEILHWGYADRASAREKGERNLRLLNEMASEKSEDFYVAYQLGRTLFNLRRFEQARVYLEKAATGEAADRNPSLARHARLLRAKNLERLGRPGEAARVLNDLVRDWPSYGPAHLALARLSYAEERWSETEDILTRYLAAEPGDPVAGGAAEQEDFTAWMLLGRCLERLGRGVEAGQAFRRAARIRPDHPEPALAQVELAAALGSLEEARALADDCRRAFPGNLRAARLMGTLSDHGA